jgi:CheY-like chemotaxis protein
LLVHLAPLACGRSHFAPSPATSLARTVPEVSVIQNAARLVVVYGTMIAGRSAGGAHGRAIIGEREKKMQKPSILYLDDDAACLGIFEVMFGNEYDVRAVLTVAEARRALEAEVFDIIISDQMMPEIDGTTFLREVAARYPASYRVMLTGNTFVGQVLSEVSTGVIQLFITKPWAETSLRQVLEHAAASSHMRSATHRAA